MKCWNCQIENPTGVGFCGHCGTRLVDSNSVFSSPPTETITYHLPNSEGKPVTVLCAEVSGLTTITAKVATEEAKEITEQILTGIKQIVAKYEGLVEQVTGDDFLFFFSVPRSHENDPVRATCSALEIHDFVNSVGSDLREKFGVPLTVRSGISTGPILALSEANPERGSSGLVDSGVNVASGLRGLANLGEILMSYDSRIGSTDFLQFEDLGFKKLGGKSSAIRILRVLNRKGLRQAARFYPQIMSEMIGRDKELSMLEFQVIKAITGEGSIVNVVGEAGVGKSRLIAELKKCEAMKRVTLFQGRAISIGKNLSFHPVIDLFKNWAGISESDSEITRLAKLERAIRTTYPEETTEIFPFVATLMGMELSGGYAERLSGIEGEALERLILKSVKELLIKEAHLRPAVIVLEDIHWADNSSREFLQSLYPLVKDHGIVFINVFRQGYVESQYDSIAKIGPENNIPDLLINVQPLDEEKSQTLVENLVATVCLPHTVKRRIIELAEGNPFFIEEIVRSLIDQGVIVRKGGGFEITDKIDRVVIPSTIKDLVTARINRLDDRTQELVKVASVIGKSFFYRVVKDIGKSIEDIDDKLAYLEDVQLIRSRMRMGELEFFFIHALVQEAVYDSILFKHRKHLHLKVAKSIEHIFRYRLHEFYGVLAYHYGKAEDPEKTEDFLIKAGQEALRSSASNEALTYYQEGLNVYRMLRGDKDDPEKTAIFEKNIGLALFNRGRYGEAVEHLDKALIHYWGELPQNTISTAFRLLSGSVAFFLALYFPSRWFNRIPTQQEVEAVELFLKKARALSVIDPTRFFVEFFLFYAAVVRFDLAKFKFGVAVFAGSSALFSFSGLSFNTAKRILDYVKPRLDTADARQLIIYDLMDTQQLFLKGQWNDISEYNEEFGNRMLGIGEVWEAVLYYYWHGLPKIFQGHFEEANLLVTKVFEIADAYQNNIYRLLKYLMNIFLLIECRDLPEATTEVNRGIDLVQHEGWNLSMLNMCSLKAFICLMMKDMEQAEKSLDQANQIISDVHAAPIHLSIFYRSQFQYHLRHMEEASSNVYMEEASEHRRSASKYGKMLVKVCEKAALYRTECYRLMGTYKWLVRDQKSASKWWQKAVGEGERLGALPQLSRTYAEMGMRFLTTEAELSNLDVKRTVEPLQRAKTMFGHLKLRHDLEDLQLVLGRISQETFKL